MAIKRKKGSPLLEGHLDAEILPGFIDSGLIRGDGGKLKTMKTNLMTSKQPGKNKSCVLNYIREKEITINVFLKTCLNFQLRFREDPYCEVRYIYLKNLFKKQEVLWDQFGVKSNSSVAEPVATLV